MTKVTYDPDEEQIAEGALPNVTQQFGYDFTAGKAVEVTNPAHLRKFAGHPYFRVSGAQPTDNSVVRTAAERESAMLGSGSQDIVTGAPKDAPRVAPATPVETPAPVTPGQADGPDGDSDLRAVHRGRGVYAVMEGDKDEEVVTGLDKTDAAAFNQLDGDAKLARLAELKAAAA